MLRAKTQVAVLKTIGWTVPLILRPHLACRYGILCGRQEIFLLTESKI